MTRRQPEIAEPVTEYLSVLLSAWLRALAPHLDALVSPLGRDAHSHSVAAVVIAAFAIESYTARLMVRNRWRGDNSVEFLREGLPDFPPNLAASVDELFLLRNSLVHNHIWRMRATWGEGPFTPEGIERLTGRLPRAGAAVTADRRFTRRHRFNLIPELVGYSDVRKAVAILVKVLDALAGLDAQNMPLAADNTVLVLDHPPRHRPLRAFSRMPQTPPRRAGWPPHRDRRGNCAPPSDSRSRPLGLT